MRTKLYQTFAILLVVGMLFSMVAPSAALAKPQEPQASILVAPEVLADMETNGSASYWIDFKFERRWLLFLMSCRVDIGHLLSCSLFPTRKGKQS